MSIQQFRIFHLFNLYNKGKKYEGKVSAKLQQKTLFLFFLFLFFLYFLHQILVSLGGSCFYKKENLSCWSSRKKTKVKPCCACTDILAKIVHLLPNFVSEPLHTLSISLYKLTLKLISSRKSLNMIFPENRNGT